MGVMYDGESFWKSKLGSHELKVREENTIYILLAQLPII